jgi:hypothetical protein
MARRSHVAAAVVLAWSVVGCGSAAGPGGDGSTCPFDGTDRIAYDGTATVDVAYADALGATYEQTYTRTDAGVEVEPPVTDGALVEPNPVHLTLGTRDDAVLGTVVVNSAVPFVDPEDGEHFILTYWALVADCDRITGTLTDNHPGATLANEVWARKDLGGGAGAIDWPFRFATGATLEATADGRSIDVVVRGKDVEGILTFTIHLTATA